jgi:endonuclease/exonuclease/phosphatase family metal-dependent hydrolase
MNWLEVSGLSRSVAITRRVMLHTVSMSTTLAFALAVLALGISVAAEPPEAPASATFRLLTWNIQMLPTLVSFASESLQKKQHLRAPWIIEYLREGNYDIVVLQEVLDPKITEQIKRELKQSYPHIVAPASKAGIAGTTGGILFLSKLPIKYVTHNVFKNISGIDRLAEKGCVLVEIDLNGCRCQIAGTHLQAGDEKMRELEFAEIATDILGPYGKPGLPQILAGDMNVAPQLDRKGSSFEKLLTTTNMTAFPLNDERPFTVDSTNSWNHHLRVPRHIDHVLLNSQGTKSTITRQTIIRPTKEHRGETIDYADHYGVVAEISIAK